MRTRVVDSGGPSIIAKNLVPREYTILESPLKPVFGGIGNSQTPVNGYVVLPVHLPNSAALSGDERSARIAKMWVEFQVVDSCPAGYLLGIDAMAAYKISIDYPKLAITLQVFEPPIKIPIATQAKCITKQVNPQIYATEPVNIRLYSEIWVPVRFMPLNQHSDLLVTPVHHANIAEGTYATCSYAVMANDTSHLLMINPGPRPVRISKDTVVGMYEPFQTNTPCSYYGTVSQVSANQGITQMTTVGLQQETRCLVDPGKPLTPTNWTPPMEKDELYAHITPTLAMDDPNLTWHNGVDQPVDPFGLEWEFKETGPLQPHPYTGKSQQINTDVRTESTTNNPRASKPLPKRPPARGESPARSRTERRAGERGTSKSGNDRGENKMKPSKYESQEEKDANDANDPEWDMNDLEWDICPDLTRGERRDWKRMLRKFRKVFSGPEEKLGKVDSKFDIDIDADPKEIKSQQPYRTSPRKRKLINDAVTKLKALDVIEPLTSEVASLVVIVIQRANRVSV